MDKPLKIDTGPDIQLRGELVVSPSEAKSPTGVNMPAGGAPWMPSPAVLEYRTRTHSRGRRTRCRVMRRCSLGWPGERRQNGFLARPRCPLVRRLLGVIYPDWGSGPRAIVGNRTIWFSFVGEGMTYVQKERLPTTLTGSAVTRCASAVTGAWSLRKMPPH